MNIEIRSVSKRFGNFEALRNINMRVGQGELVALLGPSGSGKTTLLRLIAGLDEIDPGSEGQILINGVDIIGKPVGERRIGFVFQHYALFRHMTVFENIAFGLRVKPRRQRPDENVIMARVRELLDLIQLGGIQNRYPSQLSGGQRQRVALARALAIRPDILLLDEPFGALDARVRADLRRWLRRLHNEIQITSVLVTHDQEEALEVADRIIVINNGAIEQNGSPDEVFHHPATPFVMQFLGNVNLFHGRVVDGRVLLAQASTDGRDAVPVFVRPHELSIDRRRISDSALQASVERILSAGPTVKIELLSEHGQPVFVEITHEQFRETQIVIGEKVYVSPRNARHFFVNGAGI